MSEQSSNTSQTASAFYDPDSWCWRTSQGSLLSEEYPLLERLPDWGTTAGGALCVQATPEHLTGVRDGSASPNLPTPRTSDTNGPGIHGDGGLDLRTAAALLPTPTTVDSHSAGRSQGALLAGDTLNLNLREAVKMLPTSAPTTKPSDDGNTSSDDQHQPPPMIEDCDPSSSSG